MLRPKHIRPTMIAWREMFIASFEQDRPDDAEYWRRELSDPDALMVTYAAYEGRVYEAPVEGQDQKFTVYQ